MYAIVQYFNKLVFSLLPETKCFGLKRFLLRLSGAQIGQNVRVCSSVMVIGAGELIIGDNTWVGHRCVLSASSRIEIGRNVDIAPNVFIGNGTHEITPGSERIADIELAKDIKIGDGCWLCANTVILAGVTIGNKCVAAAGAVVTRSFDDMNFIAGMPAVVKKKLS